MNRDWESMFLSWTKPASDTEENHCANAETMIREAIRSSQELRGKNMDIFAQGSYKNNTNVKANSDVDICVCLTSTFYYDLSPVPGLTKEEAQISDSDYSYAEFKDSVQRALVSKFGSGSVVRGNKAFDIKANTYRVSADAIATFEHRRYVRRLPDSSLQYQIGTKFVDDAGNVTINWPHHNYQSGVDKNKRTSNRFKFVTRIVKRLRNEMADGGIQEADPIASYLVECLLWNVPDAVYLHDKYSDEIKFVLLWLFQNTGSDSDCLSWKEVNGIKSLFSSEQKWTSGQVNSFIAEAWRYIGYH